MTAVEHQGRPGYIGLGHELVHALHIMKGTLSKATDEVRYWYINTNGDTVSSVAPREEVATVGIITRVSGVSENDLRLEHGLRIRTAY